MGKSEEQEIHSFLRQIERLSNRLSPRSFPASELQDFLNYQFDIADLQRNIQRKISETKTRARRDKTLNEHLRHLRIVRWHARRLGDGVAWMALLFDRKTIHALAQNNRVPIAPSEDDGSRGVAATAKNLLENGWGLPVIHDITDCLRIGDITFTSFGEGPEDSFFRTLEVKTRRVKEIADEDGTTVELQVTTIGTEPFPSFSENTVVDQTGTSTESDRAQGGGRRDDRRLDKQFDRMAKAVAYRTAESYKMHQVDGMPHIHVESGIEDRSHWTEFRKAIRLAREHGYSYFSIDGFIGYALLYNTNGVGDRDIEKYDFATDLKKSIISQQGAGFPDKLTISAIPIEENNKYAPFLMPFMLYDVPRRAISDILHGRLLVVAAMNTGKVEQALSQAGFTIESDRESKDSRSFKLRTELVWPTGERLQAEVPAPWREMMASVHEFLGLESIVSKTAACKSMPARIPFQDFIQSGGLGATGEEQSGELRQDHGRPL